MFDTIHLVWIIPLSALAGGFVLLVIFLNGVLHEMKARKKRNDNSSGTPADRTA